MENLNLLHYDSPEIFLGNNKKRYFSSNYKKIKYDIHELMIYQNILVGSLNLDWPNLWAEKGGKKLKPHLGSLEFYVIAVRFVEYYILIIDNMKKCCLNKIWVKDFVSKAGNEAVESDSDIRCQCRKLSQTREGQKITSRFEIKIGKASVTISTEYDTCDEKPCFSSCNDSAHVSVESIIKAKEYKYSYYDLGYKIPMHKISNIIINRNEQHITADVEAINSELSSDFSGIGNAFQPYITYCDIIPITGQLSQMLLFSLDNLTRENASNLWMRSVDCKYHTPITDIAKVKLSVKDSKKIRVSDDQYYRAVTLYLDLDDEKMTSICKFAYQL